MGKLCAHLYFVEFHVCWCLYLFLLEAVGWLIARGKERKNITFCVLDILRKRDEHGEGEGCILHSLRIFFNRVYEFVIGLEVFCTFVLCLSYRLTLLMENLFWRMVTNSYFGLFSFSISNFVVHFLFVVNYFVKETMVIGHCCGQ